MIIIYIYIAHNNQEDSLCALQELSYIYIYSENRFHKTTGVCFCTKFIR